MKKVTQIIKRVIASVKDGSLRVESPKVTIVARAAAQARLKADIVLKSIIAKETVISKIKTLGNFEGLIVEIVGTMSVGNIKWFLYKQVDTAEIVDSINIDVFKNDMQEVLISEYLSKTLIKNLIDSSMAFEEVEWSFEKPLLDFSVTEEYFAIEVSFLRELIDIVVVDELFRIGVKKGYQADVTVTDIISRHFNKYAEDIVYTSETTSSYIPSTSPEIDDATSVVEYITNVMDYAYIVNLGYYVDDEFISPLYVQDGYGEIITVDEDIINSVDYVFIVNYEHYLIPDYVLPFYVHGDHGEVIAVDETIEYLVNSNRAFLDYSSIHDDIVIDFSKTAYEDVNTVETILLSLGANLESLDVISISEAVLLSSGINRPISEVSDIIESILLSTGFNKSVSDVSSAIETITVILSRATSFLDIITATEAVQKQLNKNVDDISAISETFSNALSMVKPETTNVTESINISMGDYALQDYFAEDYNVLLIII